MFLKEKFIRVCVINRRYNFCSRFICSDGSKQSECAIKNAQSIMDFDVIPKAKRLPLIGTKLDFLSTGFGKRFV